MRILLTLFVLLFSSLVFAEDISDFEIGGMSIGNSLLNYLSQEEILKEFELNKDQYSWTDQKFIDVYIFQGNENYEYFSTSVKRKDNKYIIYSIRGMIDYKNINDCLKKQKEIADELSSIFKKAKIFKDSFNHSGDSTGESKVHDINFVINGGSIRVVCYDFAKHMSYVSGLDVAIHTEERSKWLQKFHKN